MTYIYFYAVHKCHNVWLVDYIYAELYCTESQDRLEIDISLFGLQNSHSTNFSFSACSHVALRSSVVKSSGLRSDLNQLRLKL